MSNGKNKPDVPSKTKDEGLFAKIKVGTIVSVLWDDGITYEAKVESHHKTMYSKITVVFTDDGVESNVKMSSQSTKGFGIVDIVSNAKAKAETTTRTTTKASKKSAATTSISSSSSTGKKRTKISKATAKAKAKTTTKATTKASKKSAASTSTSSSSSKGKKRTKTSKATAKTKTKTATKATTKVSKKNAATTSTSSSSSSSSSTGKKRSRPTTKPVKTKSSNKKKKKNTQTKTKPQSLWPGGSNWKPTHTGWGTRNPNNFGCGKCRWRPKGCRGCIASSQLYVAAAPPIIRGVIQLPTPPPKDYEARQKIIADTILQRFNIVNGPQQSDANGYGIVVVGRPFSQGETIVDPSVMLVRRPAAYGKAHLGPYDYVAPGSSTSASSGYFQLREPALGHCSLTYYINEARNGQVPNAEFSTVRSGGSFEPKFCLRALVDIQVGEEVLVFYNQDL
jgi:hypothetical protein